MRTAASPFAVASLMNVVRAGAAATASATVMLITAISTSTATAKRRRRRAVVTAENDRTTTRSVSLCFRKRATALTSAACLVLLPSEKTLSPAMRMPKTSASSSVLLLNTVWLPAVIRPPFGGAPRRRRPAPATNVRLSSGNTSRCTSGTAPLLVSATLHTTPDPPMADTFATSFGTSPSGAEIAMSHEQAPLQASGPLRVTVVVRLRRRSAALMTLPDAHMGMRSVHTSFESSRESVNDPAARRPVPCCTSRTWTVTSPVPVSNRVCAPYRDDLVAARSGTLPTFSIHVTDHVYRPSPCAWRVTLTRPVPMDEMATDSAAAETS